MAVKTTLSASILLNYTLCKFWQIFFCTNALNYRGAFSICALLINMWYIINQSSNGCEVQYSFAIHMCFNQVFIFN